MVPVKIRDNGRLIQFKSRSIFLEMIGKSETYLQTRHFKEANAGVTFQQLWDRNKTGHDNLERHIAGQKPLVTDEGVMAYDGDHILIAPISLISDDRPTNAPVATGTVVSHPVFDAMIHFFIDKTAEYVAGHGEGAVENAHAMYNSITNLELSKSQDRIVAINNDVDHPLVWMLNKYYASEDA